jgi:predicted amino acid dehydrogenase
MATSTPQNQVRNTFLGLGCIEGWQLAGGGKGGKLDLVLVVHPRDEGDVPRLYPWSAQLSVAERRLLIQRFRPTFGEVVPNPRFTTGYLFIPCYSDEMMDPRTRGRCRDGLEEGLRYAAEMGARTVCLGGLTGSLSGYGRKVQGLAQELGLALTTGHSVTALVVLRTYLKALEALGREPEDQSLCLLGLGSVGGAFLRLLALRRHLPRTLTVVERPGRADHVRALAEELRTRYCAPLELELTSAAGHLDADSACYRSDAVVSAVSTPHVIDPLRVAPGAILIDDSQPHCWSREDAWARCRDRLDLVPCEAGLVDCSSLQFRSRFPFDFADATEAGSSTSWCCLTEGMLRTLDPGLPLTLGEPSLENLLSYEAAFDRVGLAVSTLQCGPHRLPISAIASHLRGRPVRPARAVFPAVPALAAAP